MSTRTQSWPSCCGARIIHTFDEDPTEVNAKAHIAGMGPGTYGGGAGVMVWIDNLNTNPRATYTPQGLKSTTAGTNPGQEWAKLYRKMGYRVDEYQLAGNPVHNESDVSAMLTMYILFANSLKKTPHRVTKVGDPNHEEELKRLSDAQGVLTRELEEARGEAERLRRITVQRRKRRLAKRAGTGLQRTARATV